MPKVSVIIPTYNCAQYIKQALDSVLNQTYKDFEIIIIDDGSTDDTGKTLEPYRAAGKIRYFFQENKGHAGARNSGLQKASGDYIAFLDSDDIWEPSKLTKQVDFLDGNHHIGLVHCSAYMIDEKGNNHGVYDGYSRNKRFLGGSIFTHLLLRRAFINCSTPLLRSHYLTNIGFFDEQLSRLGSEDKDFWIRFSKETLVHFIDEPLVYWRIREKSASSNSENLAKAQRYTVDKLFSRKTISFLLCRQACGCIYKELADGYFRNGQFKKAAEIYLKSILFFPFIFMCYLNFIRSCLRYSKHNVR